MLEMEKISQSSRQHQMPKDELDFTTGDDGEDEEEDEEEDDARREESALR
jgi:hypothetical protein